MAEGQEEVHTDEVSGVSWNQPICSTCFAALEVGRGNVPREPSRVVNADEPCLICGEGNTGIYVRIDPTIAGVFANARREEKM